MSSLGNAKVFQSDQLLGVCFAREFDSVVPVGIEEFRQLRGWVFPFIVDEFSLVLQGSGPLDFSNSENIVDIGAYEYIDPSLNISTVGSNLLESFIYPNPATNKVTISGINSKTTVIIVDLNGKKYDLTKIIQMESNSASIDVRSLKW